MTPSGSSEDNNGSALFEFSSETADRLAARIQEYQVRSAEYPLAKNLRPYRDVAWNALRFAVQDVVSYPELRSRLARAVRQMAGRSEAEYAATAVYEAHVDATLLQHQTVSTLVGLGFHPDAFASILPEIYTEHYTLAFWVRDHRSVRAKQVREEFDRRVLTARSTLQAATNASWYLEAEFYKAKDRRVYPAYVPLRHFSQDVFPIQIGSLTSVNVADHIDRTPTRLCSADTAKKVDLHIKMPNQSVLASMGLASSDGDRRLREHLREIGFYEIVSERGNSIFTGQFLDVKLGRNSFKVLDRFFETNGGASSLILETCTGFWRGLNGLARDGSLSPVPPILVKSRR